MDVERIVTVKFDYDKNRVDPTKFSLLLETNGDVNALTDFVGEFATLRDADADPVEEFSLLVTFNNVKSESVYNDTQGRLVAVLQAESVSLSEDNSDDDEKNRKDLKKFEKKSVSLEKKVDSLESEVASLKESLSEVTAERDGLKRDLESATNPANSSTKETSSESVGDAGNAQT